MKRMNKILLGVVAIIFVIVAIIYTVNAKLAEKDYPVATKISKETKIETTKESEVTKETIKETTKSVEEIQNKHGVIPGVTKSAEERARIRAEKEEATTLTIKMDDFYQEGDYVYVEGTLKNNSPDYITYVKYNIMIGDEEGNIIQCEWSNWSGILPPGASTPVHTMIRYTPGSVKGGLFIEEIKTK